MKSSACHQADSLIWYFADQCNLADTFICVIALSFIAILVSHLSYGCLCLFLCCFTFANASLLAIWAFYFYIEVFICILFTLIYFLYLLMHFEPFSWFYFLLRPHLIVSCMAQSDSSFHLEHLFVQPVYSLGIKYATPRAASFSTLASWHRPSLWCLQHRNLSVPHLPLWQAYLFLHALQVHHTITLGVYSWPCLISGLILTLCLDQPRWHR